MAFAPISFAALQYEDFANQYLKAFEQGGTTPLPMATDATGITTASKFQLNAQGFPVTAGSALVIPFIDGPFDLWLIPTAAEADANDTSNSIQIADNQLAGAIGAIVTPQTLAEAVANISVVAGQIVQITDRKDAQFEYKTGQTPNTFNIVAADAPSLDLVLKITPDTTINAFGASSSASALTNQGAIQASIDNQSVVRGEAEVYVHDSEFTGKSNIIIDGEPGFTLQCKLAFGEVNQISFSANDNVKIFNTIFDMRNDINTPVLSGDDEENSLHFLSCTNIEIARCKFTRTLSRAIRCNATVSDETENLFVHHNEFVNGSRGGVVVRRFGRNVHVYKNVFTNSVDTSHGGVTNEKPIEVSGTIGIHIYQNKVVQTNGEGGSIIVEFIDRQSEDVHIWGNECDGQGGGNAIKVGASINIDIYSNNISNATASGVFLEGNVDCWCHHNTITLSGDNSIIVINDVDTGRVPQFNYVHDNILSEANQDANALGVPVTDGSDSKSYHIRASGGGDHIYLYRNTMKDAAATANGINLNADDAYVWGNDFEGLGAGVIAFNNRFMSPAQTYRVWDNIGLNTYDEGTSDITTGNTSITVSPNIVLNSVAGAWSLITSLRTVMNGTQAYHHYTNSANSDFNIILKTAAHGTPTNTGTVTIDWQINIESVLDGAFAGT